MIYKLHQSEGDILGFHISGTLTDEDYQERFIPELEKAIAQWGKISVFLDLEEFHGLTPHALWDDFAVGVKYHNALARIAVAGDRSWEEWATRFFKLFTKTEVKYFEHGRDQRAWIWLRERDGISVKQ